MPRIAQVCRVGAPHVGGMEGVVHGLSRALIGRGHHVEVFTLDRGDGPVDGVIDGVRYHRLPAIGPARYPFARGLVRAVQGFDLVHAHGLDGLADTLVELGPAPIGISTHGGFFHTERHAFLKELVLRTRTRRTLRRADAVWFTSEADRQRLAAAGAAGSVVPDGVALERFRGIERRPVAGRWVVFGRVDVHKGLGDLLRVASQVDGPFAIEVVGPEARPGLIAALRRQAEALGVAGQVRFHGPLGDAELVELLATVELALFPSRYEGFGLAVVELMAAGIPPVVSAIPAFDALVRSGVDGWRLDWRAPDAAARLASLRGADHVEVSAAAREAAEAHGWERRVLTFEAAYAEVLRCASA